MSDEEKVDWEVPCFPVLLKVSAIPPIFIEISISKPDQFRHDVQKKMEEGIKTENPSHSIGNRKP